LNQTANIPGLYGKIPTRGDFVTRRLSPGFVETWDTWLQKALTASKEQLGDRWLEIYLTSPLWRFLLGPGICGSALWAGILMPSVDKVGRYFPLTLAVSLSASQKQLDVFLNTADWFEQLEQLALSALEDSLDLVELDERLKQQVFPEQPRTSRVSTTHPVDADRQGKLAFHMALESIDSISVAFAQLGFRYFTQAHPMYSLWSTTGSETMKPCLQVYDNLPSLDAFSELLIGEEQDRTAISDDDDTPPDAAEQESGAERVPWSGGGIDEIERLQWFSHACTTAGKHRKRNEDACLARPEIGLWAVADGMGGHSSGDIASKTVIDALGRLSSTGYIESYASCTMECLRSVNTNLLAMADNLGEDNIIGSTVVVMLAVGMRCAVIWAGDSRLYQYRSGALTQLTQDHSLITQLSEQGITSQQAPDAEMASNIVTRALGADPDLSFDMVTFEAETDDLYILCSDGLVKELSDQDIEKILQQEKSGKSAPQLIELALQRGARDNVTVVVAHATHTGAGVAY
jgi:type VI secretion system protein ImpM